MTSSIVRLPFGEIRRRAKTLLGVKAQCGAVTFVQRFGDALNCAPHFHSVVIDGVYAADPNGRPELHDLRPPEETEVLRVATLIAERVESLLNRRGLGSDGHRDAADAFARDEPGLAAVYSSSVHSRIATGPNAGNRVVTLGDQVDGDSLDSLRSARCATVSGFRVHANVAIGALDRARLERPSSQNLNSRAPQTPVAE
jgi:hypothetical protein